MTPKELGYCIMGEKLKQKQRDKEMWQWLGSYGISMVSVAVEHCLAGRKATSEYIKEPITQTAERNKPLSEEEKQMEVDRFFARENARRLNWKRRKALMEKEMTESLI